MPIPLTDRLESAFIRKVIYPAWTARNHPAYRRYFNQFNRSQYFSEDELRALQLRLLRAQLTHAYEHVPFYRARMDRASIAPAEITSLEDFRHLPVLTKREIQTQGTEMLADDVPEDKRELNHTGGSTGSPLAFWVDKERFDSRRASTDRHNDWAGFRPGAWCAVLWGSTFDTGASAVPKLNWRQRILEPTVTLNTSLVAPKDLDEFVAQLRRRRPRFLKAYAQAADMFARYCIDNNISDIHFDGIITSAEVLTPEARAQIERVFSGRVFNRYGCREVSVIASECEYHTGMHINADALLVELEPSSDAPDAHARVLVTDLYNRSMPLIRYEIGDFAEWASGAPCPCGRKLPRIANIAGRTTDFLLLPDLSMVSGPALALLIGQTPDVRQAQFEQTSPTAVHLRVIPAEGYGPHTVKSLETRLRPYLKAQLTLTISSVGEIPGEASGKYRFVKRTF